EVGIVEATARYEAWLAERIPLIKPDLEHKHRAMSAGVFPFLRATFYRWAARWQAIVGDVARAPIVLAVGDLRGENFGPWRDGEDPRPERRADLAPTGSARGRSQGADRASRRRTRESRAPAVRRARGVARRADRARSEGTRPLRAERCGRDDPLRRHPASRRPVSRSMRQGRRCVAGAAARAGLLARTLERAAAQARRS